MIQFTESIEGGAGKPESREALIRLAKELVSQGLAPPPEIYRIEIRQVIDWAQFPTWAQPTDPEMFEGSGHEG